MGLFGAKYGPRGNAETFSALSTLESGIHRAAWGHGVQASDRAVFGVPEYGAHGT